MNTKAIKKKLQVYFETSTPEQVVKEFEALGVEFVDIDKDREKTASDMLNLFELTIRNTIDANWRPNLLKQIKQWKKELT